MAIECRDWKWWYFFVSSVGFLFGGILLIVLARLARARLCKAPKRARNDDIVIERSATGGFVVADDEPQSDGLQSWFNDLLSINAISGRILAVVTLVAVLVSIVVYIRDTYEPIEQCNVSPKDDGWLLTDIVVNFYFLLHFILRFLAADDKLSMWVSIESIVDYFTVPPIVVLLATDRYWLGFRFMRILSLMQIKNVIQVTGLIKPGLVLQLTVVVVNFVSAWLTASGCFHLFENYGDPWNNGADIQNISYPTTLYFTMVTVSTVGYGDFSPTTALGRIFFVLFIIGGLALFATYTPMFVEFFQFLSPYDRSLKEDARRKHVVVCGCITEESMGTFLADFMHKDRADKSTVVVFLHPEKPPVPIRALLKRLSSRVVYLKGSILKACDLDRVRLGSSSGCLVLANKNSPDSMAEDSANILRVVAVKNHSPNVRTIVQLIEVKSKRHLLNVPNFSQKHGDDVICISELKLGLIGQSCLCPGFSTLLANLTCMRSEIHGLHSPDGRLYERWELNYFSGSSYELYSIPLPSFFENKSFLEVVKICYKDLGLLMFAIQFPAEGNSFSKLLFNPDRSVRIKPNTEGFFVAKDEEEVQRLLEYNPAEMKSEAIELQESRREGQPVTTGARGGSGGGGKLSKLLNRKKKLLTALTGKKSNRQHGEQRQDSGIMYHTEKETTYDEALLSSMEQKELADHIVICTFGTKKSPLIGLEQMIFPLRRMTLSKSELKLIVLLGHGDYLRREWPALKRFESIRIVEGSPLERDDLQKVSLNYCDMCVILSPGTQKSDSDDSIPISFSDKECILATLNIKGMHFEDLESGPVVALDAQSPIVSGSLARRRRMRDRLLIDGKDVPIITELVIDSNVQFLEQDDEDDPTGELYCSSPFAHGTTLSVSVLDSFLSATYFNDDVLDVVKTLITGQVPWSQRKMHGGSNSNEDASGTGAGNCILRLLYLADTRYRSYASEGRQYMDLLFALLENEGMLSLGIYRSRELTDPCGKRYVITAPSADFPLEAYDKIYVLTSPNRESLADFSTSPPLMVKTRTADDSDGIRITEDPVSNV